MGSRAEFRIELVLTGSYTACSILAAAAIARSRHCCQISHLLLCVDGYAVEPVLRSFHEAHPLLDRPQIRYVVTIPRWPFPRGEADRALLRCNLDRFGSFARVKYILAEKQEYDSWHKLLLECGVLAPRPVHVVNSSEFEVVEDEQWRRIASAADAAHRGSRNLLVQEAEAVIRRARRICQPQVMINWMRALVDGRT